MGAKEKTELFKQKHNYDYQKTLQYNRTPNI